MGILLNQVKLAVPASRNEPGREYLQHVQKGTEDPKIGVLTDVVAIRQRLNSDKESIANMQVTLLQQTEESTSLKDKVSQLELSHDLNILMQLDAHRINMLVQFADFLNTEDQKRPSGTTPQEISPALVRAASGRALVDRFNRWERAATGLEESDRKLLHDHHSLEACKEASNEFAHHSVEQFATLLCTGGLERQYSEWTRVIKAMTGQTIEELSTSYREILAGLR